MNVLLLAPPVLVLFLQGATLAEFAKGAMAGLAVQAVLAAPFLATNPGAYFAGAFDIGRVFLHQWSVNFQFVSEAVFTSRTFAVALLALHAFLLALMVWRWMTPKDLPCSVALTAFVRASRPPTHPGLGAGASAVLRVPSARAREIAAAAQEESLGAKEGGWGLGPLEGRGAYGGVTWAFERGSRTSTETRGGGREETGSLTPPHLPGSPAPSKDRDRDRRSARTSLARLSTSHVLYVLLTGHLAGVISARTLHYQFYAWYFQHIPALLWFTDLPVFSRLALWAAIEFCWNVYPPSLHTSLGLLALHVTLLGSLWLAPQPPAVEEGPHRSRARSLF